MKPYEDAVEYWVRDFIDTMDGGTLLPGDRSGDEPPGVKIIFDGYGTNEETNEQDDQNVLSFAVFVHKTSLDQPFPEHEQTPWALLHRSAEEVCIWVWYDSKKDSIDVVPFEDGDTHLEHEFVYKLIDKIWEAHYND